MKSSFFSTGLLKKTAAVLCSAVLAAAGTGGFRPAPSETAYGADVSRNVSEEIGLVGNLFSIAGTNTADHAALQWATTLPADSFTLCRSTDPDIGYVPI